MAKEINRLSFEIEHYNGSTYFGFELSIKDDGTVDVLRTSDCSLADVEEDYMFDTENSLYRIQSERPILEEEYNEIRECYEENQQVKKKTL